MDKNTSFAKPISSEQMACNISEQYPQLPSKSCYEIWNLFFTDYTFEYILEQTKLYATRDKNDPTFDIYITNLKHFIGILIFSGYHFVTSERHYWSTQSDLKVPFVSEIIISSEKKFENKNIFMLLTIKIWKWETV